MAFSNVAYIGNGSQTIFDIPFPYLSQDHISAQIDGVLTTAYTFISASQIQFDTPPPDQSVVFIERSTSPDERLVVYTNNAFLGAGPLNDDSLQAFYLAQEGLDAITTALPLDPADLTWDGQSRRLKDLAAPSVPGDAVNKQYADDLAIQQGNVPPPGAGQVGSVLTATGTGTYDWDLPGGRVMLANFQPSDMAGVPTGKTPAELGTTDHVLDGSVPANLFDRDVNEAAMGSFMAPPTIENGTLRLHLFLTTTVVTSQSVVFRAYLARTVPGSDLLTFLGPSVTETLSMNPGGSRLFEQTFTFPSNGNLNPVPGAFNHYSLVIERLATDPGDSVPGDAAVVGAVLTGPVSQLILDDTV